jgi:D-alanyl-D-alanine dipeptidase
MKGQILKALPRAAWEGITIEENGESLVECLDSPRLKLGSTDKGYPTSFLIRKSVLEKLQRVVENLPAGFKLMLIEGYRSVEAQKLSWDRKVEKLRAEHSEWTEEQIEAQVRLVVAKPNPLANHNCGGAVDVTLLLNDEEIDMGTPYPNEALGSEWYKKFPMLSLEITEEQRKHREILRTAMETEDFVWYPGEWWHYCWGDRMWAVYSNQTKCFYGPATQ